MRSIRLGVIFASCIVAATVCVAAISYDSPARKEMKRADLSGAPGMEVISSFSEYKKGEEIPRHIHHGIETGYVLQGTMVQLPGKEPMMIETGAPILNLRDVPHAGYKVVGDQPLKLFTVHIVDKGKPPIRLGKVSGSSDPCKQALARRAGNREVLSSRRTTVAGR